MANKWTIFLRKYAKKHGLSYRNAFNSSAAKKEYHKQQENMKKGGITAKFRGKTYLVKGGSNEVVDLATGNNAELSYNPAEKKLQEPANVVKAMKTRKRRN
jgi:hypothetical protein